MHAAAYRGCARANLNLLYASTLYAPSTTSTNLRLASTSSSSSTSSSGANLYPYPTAPHPSPHQIFHLPPSASQAEVKARYYQLVRVYHPDAPTARLIPPHIAQARFHAISRAYDVLRGRSPAGALDDGSGLGAGLGKRVRDFHDLSSAMRRRARRRGAEMNVPMDDRWKDRLFLGSLLIAVGVFVMQTSMARRSSIGEALDRGAFEAAVIRSRAGESSDRSRTGEGTVRRSRGDDDALDAEAGVRTGRE